VTKNKTKVRATEPEGAEHICPGCAVHEALDQTLDILATEPASSELSFESVLDAASEVVTEGACTKHLDVDIIVTLAVGLLTDRVCAELIDAEVA
jgi:hypothetical protein